LHPQLLGRSLKCSVCDLLAPSRELDILGRSLAVLREVILQPGGGAVTLWAVFTITVIC